MNNSAATPELSVVIPVCNVEPWLSQCLNSVIRQTFTAWECICVDDGSADLSGRICDNFARRDSRFRVIHQDNQGVSVARNAGMDAASGPLLAFIDPDDYIGNNYFHALVRDMRCSGAEVATASRCIIRENGKEDGFELLNWFERRVNEKYQHKMMDNNGVIDAIADGAFDCSCWGKIYCRDLWGATKFPVGVDYGEDLMVVLNVIARAKSAVYAPKAIYYYRQRHGSLVHNDLTKERLLKCFRASKAMVEHLSEHYPERRKDFEQLRFQHDINAFNSFVARGHAKKGRSLLLQMMEIRRLVEKEDDSEI